MKYPTSETTKQELSGRLENTHEPEAAGEDLHSERSQISVACGGKPSITILPISMTW